MVVNNLQDIKKALKTSREKQKRSIYSVAKDGKVTQTQLAEIENGELGMTAKTLINLCNSLNLTIKIEPNDKK